MPILSAPLVCGYSGSIIVATYYAGVDIMNSTYDELSKYLELTPKSKAVWDNSCEYLPGGDSRNSIYWSPYPIFINSAKGSIVTDIDGCDRLDFINTMTTMILGHGFQPVIDGVRGQLDDGVGYNAPNTHQVELAQRLCERIPSLDLVRFTNSGTEATLNTIRAARAFTGRTSIAKVEGGYHGTHDTVSVSVRVNVSKAGSALSPEPLAASEGIPSEILDQVIVLPFNDIEVALNILETHHSDLAAVIVEPVMGSVGMVPATHEFLSMLRRFTQEHGIVLIFDEVISYRVSSGGCQAHYGITPDMTALGKIIGGGFPVGAFGGRRDIMELYDPRLGPRVTHAGTFNGNPISMLAGVITLDNLTPDVYQDLEIHAQVLRSQIHDICIDLEVPAQITGIGSLFGIHFVDHEIHNYRDIANCDTELRDRVFLGMMNEGILVAPNLVGALSTETKAEEVRVFCEIFRKVLSRNI